METLWTIHRLEVKPTDGTHSNVVSIVHWVSQITGGGNVVSEIGMTELDSPSDSFIAYETLTQEQAIIWLRNKLGDEVANIESRLVQKLDALNNPPLVSLRLPWLPEK